MSYTTAVLGAISYVRKNPANKDVTPVSKWLRRVRAEQGLEQAEFGSYIGKSGAMVGYMEKGKRSVTPKTIAAVLSAFPGTESPPLGNEVQVTGQALSTAQLVKIKYAGTVPCSTDWGDPLSAEETRDIEPKFAGSNRFMCRVSGDSCYPALQQGDLTVWESDRDPPYGIIALAQRDEDHACTVKQLTYDEKEYRPRLKPVNPKYEAPPDAGGWYVVARLVGVIRPGKAERTWYAATGLTPLDLL